VDYRSTSLVRNGTNTLLEHIKIGSQPANERQGFWKFRFIAGLDRAGNPGKKQENTLAVGVHGLIYVDESKRFRKHLETNRKGIRYTILGSELISRRTAAKDKCM